jgi:DNA-binding MarR family transcriptional regulator
MSERAQGRPQGRRHSPEQIRAASEFLGEWRERLAVHPEVTPGQFRCAYALSLAVSWSNFEAFPSQATIADRVHVTEKLARDAFKKLEELGFLEATRRARTSKRYRLTLPDRKKSTVHNDDDRKKSTVHEDGMTGKNRLSRPEKIDCYEPSIFSPMTGKNRPSNNYNLTTTTERLPPYDLAAVAPARPPARAVAPSPRHDPEIPQSTSGSLSRLPARSPAELDQSGPRDDDCTSPPIERFETLDPGPGEDDLPLVDAPRPPALRPARRSTSARFATLFAGCDPGEEWEPEEPEDEAPATPYATTEEGMPF